MYNLRKDYPLERLKLLFEWPCLHVRSIDISDVESESLGWCDSRAIDQSASGRSLIPLRRDH